MPTRSIFREGTLEGTATSSWEAESWAADCLCRPGVPRGKTDFDDSFTYCLHLPFCGQFSSGLSSSSCTKSPPCRPRLTCLARQEAHFTPAETEAGSWDVAGVTLVARPVVQTETCSQPVLRALSMASYPISNAKLAPSTPATAPIRRSGAAVPAVHARMAVRKAFFLQHFSRATLLLRSRS